MKKAMLILLLLAGNVLLMQTNAQVSVGINIGVQPIWGPVGYDYVDYYYFPDVEAYYYVPQRQYVYQERGKWIRTSALPARFGRFDIYHSYKVVINEPKPYLNHNTYKVKYVSFKGNRTQIVIRDSREEKYFVVKGHPEHSKWKASHGKTGNRGQYKKLDHEQHKSSGQGAKKGGGHRKKWDSL